MTTTTAFANRHTFTISVEGSKTGEKWNGAFACKILLSHADELALDRRRRELIGGDGQTAADPENVKRAVIFAELSVRLTEAAAWWTANSGGLNLLDTEPVIEVYNECMRVEADHLAQLKARAAEAQLKLRAEAEAKVMGADAPKPLGT